eukprot:scaffold4144_cov82-Cylindrotheca_fusiformis.AAC.1
MFADGQLLLSLCFYETFLSMQLAFTPTAQTLAALIGMRFPILCNLYDESSAVYDYVIELEKLYLGLTPLQQSQA